MEAEGPTGLRFQFPSHSIVPDPEPDSAYLGSLDRIYRQVLSTSPSYPLVICINSDEPF